MYESSNIKYILYSSLVLKHNIETYDEKEKAEAIIKELFEYTLSFINNEKSNLSSLEDALSLIDTKKDNFLEKDNFFRYYTFALLYSYSLFQGYTPLWFIKNDIVLSPEFVLKEDDTLDSINTRMFDDPKSITLCVLEDFKKRFIKKDITLKL
ncbi:MAG: hypothetical protein RSB41_03375 [Bacilli bacterium]